MRGNVNKRTDTQANSQRSNRPKKAYEKPLFRHEPIFETSALACGKINGSAAQCRSNRKAS
jgi:hypothetical protein